jgi:hypothetical protein
MKTHDGDHQPTSTHTNLTPEQMKARLLEVNAEMDSPMLEQVTLTDPRQRAVEAKAREQAWLALDRERDWLQCALFVGVEKMSTPYPRSSKNKAN